MPLDPKEWDQAQERNLETYKLWKSELLVDLSRVKEIYKEDGESESTFAADLDLAKKLYKEMRI